MVFKNNYLVVGSFILLCGFGSSTRAMLPRRAVGRIAGYYRTKFDHWNPAGSVERRVQKYKNKEEAKLLKTITPLFCQKKEPMLWLKDGHKMPQEDVINATSYFRSVRGMDPPDLFEMILPLLESYPNTLTAWLQSPLPYTLQEIIEKCDSQTTQPPEMPYPNLLQIMRLLAYQIDGEKMRLVEDREELAMPAEVCCKPQFSETVYNDPDDLQEIAHIIGPDALAQLKKEKDALHKFILSLHVARTHGYQQFP